MKKALLCRTLVILLLAAIPAGLTATPSEAAAVPAVNIQFNQTDEPEEVSNLIKILFVLTTLSLAPSILIMMTSFTRLAVVFSFLRHAMGTQQAPSNQIIISLALFLTVFIMAPVWSKINESALQPYLNHELSQAKALELAAFPVREFMFSQTRKSDLALFLDIARLERPADKDAVPLTALIPAFIISELKTAFTIGFIIYIPFLIIDMVVASVLLSMGMMMLPPVMISLPFKLMLFVLVDGWNLLIGSMVRSFG